LLLMVSTNLGQAVAAFATALNGLRERYVENFAASLDEPFNRRKLGAVRVSDTIALQRKEFAAEFVNSTSLPVIGRLCPDSEQGIVEQLNGLLIQSHAQKPGVLEAARTTPGSGMLRAIIGAGFGAAAALIFTATQMYDPPGEYIHPPASSISPPGASASGPTVNGAAPDPEVKSAAFPEVPPNASASSGTQASPSNSLASSPALVGVMPKQAHFLESTLFWIVGGTLGAVLGTSLAGFLPLQMFGRLGGRSFAIAQDRRSAVEALRQELMAESNFWSLMAGGLVSQKTDFHVVAALKSLILEHRERNEHSEDILQLIEQELGLVVGGKMTEGATPALGDFVWAAEHEKLYDTFGIVEIGDRVKVKVPPRTVTSRSGALTVVQRGLVSRQREH
jgi:hypothetical protein